MKHLEDQLQIQVANYLRYQYPNVLFMHVPNGGKRGIKEATRFKKMGVLAGVPDILIFYSGSTYFGNYVGMFIELKIKPNRPNENQIQIMRKLTLNQWYGGVCYSFEEAKELIDNYLK